MVTQRNVPTQTSFINPIEHDYIILVGYASAFLSSIADQPQCPAGFSTAVPRSSFPMIRKNFFNSSAWLTGTLNCLISYVRVYFSTFPSVTILLWVAPKGIISVRRSG